MDSGEAPRMPFGKHKGKFLWDVDTNYLDWLLGRELREPLKGQIIAELNSRDEWRSGAFIEDKETENGESDE